MLVGFQVFENIIWGSAEWRPNRMQKALKKRFSVGA
jgi:hypothetical protein